MRWRKALLAGAVLIAGAISVLLGFRAAHDPYLALLTDRIDALLPVVERELGARVPRPIRVVVSTREEIGEIIQRESVDTLEAIEGPPPGGRPAADAEGPWTAHGVLGTVDRDGRIHVCRQELEGAPHGDLIGAFLDVINGPGKPADPRALDGVLAHELVHVYQERTLGLRAYLRGARHRSDLLARRAVIEGHASLVDSRVVPAASPEEREWSAELARVLEEVSGNYGLLDDGPKAVRRVFPYREGRDFVESAFARLGGGEALRRLFAEPPSLAQVERPETWPGPRDPEAGTDAALRRMRLWLETEWPGVLGMFGVSGEPLPPSLFLELLRPASPGARDAAAAALLEAQSLEGWGAVGGHRVSGHLLAARDDAGARSLLDSWVEAARARDALVPMTPQQRRARVLESAWTEASIDGTPALLATRRFRFRVPRLEHAVAVRRGRFVLELRLVDDPGGAQAALRLARCLLACLGDGADRGDPGAAAWEERWRFAVRPESGPEGLRRLLGDPDPDVRLAAFRHLQRRSALTGEERERARGDPDPPLRLAALAGGARGEKPPVEDLLAAARDPDPWVAAGGWNAVKDHFAGSGIPFEEIAAALRRPEAPVRFAASGVLGTFDPGDADLLPLLRIALADGDPGVRSQGAVPLLHLPRATPGLGAVFAGLLTGPDEDLRRDALIQLSIRDGVAGTAEALLPFLDVEEDADLAVEALGKQGAEARAAIPRLRRMAEEAGGTEGTRRRLGALAALAGIEGRKSEVLSHIRRLLATGTEEEAQVALHFLDDLGASADMVPELTARLRSGSALHRIAVLAALERAGIAAEPALGEIETLCGSEDPVLRARARKAGEAIRKWNREFRGE